MKPGVNILRAGPYQVTAARKRIKNMYLRLGGEENALLVSAPYQAADQEIISFVLSKEKWIREALLRRPARDGTIPLWGKSYPAQAREGKNDMTFDGDRFVLRLAQPDLERYQNGGAPPESLLRAFYRRELERVLPALWERITAEAGERGVQLRLKWMKTRWGTCNPSARRVWLNPRLAQYPPDCLQYVAVHELCHLLVPRHDRAFYALLDARMPGWPALRARLLQAPRLPQQESAHEVQDHAQG